ncbi:unnamed protein product [Coregonus sp. 'balchen']|nr:unnamed protein product [Coregonus sp. 'balchen']
MALNTDLRLFTISRHPHPDNRRLLGQIYPPHPTKKTDILFDHVQEGNYRISIRNQDPKSPVAMHFMTARHVASLKYMGIVHVKVPRQGGDIDRRLLQRESYWIFSLETMSPKGLNEDFPISHFL